MSRASLLTDDQWREWGQRHRDDGVTLAEIGRRVGLNERTVGWHFRRLRIETRSSKEASARRRRLDHDEVWRLHDEGMAVADIARRLGAAWSTIHGIVKPTTGARAGSPASAAADRALRRQWDAERARIKADRQRREEQARWR